MRHGAERPLTQRKATHFDALFPDAQQKWATVRDLPPDLAIHEALAFDREKCRRGFVPWSTPDVTDGCRLR